MILLYSLFYGSTKFVDLNGVKQWLPNYGPLRIFIRPANVFFKKNIYTHFEPQLDRIMSEIPSFNVIYFFIILEITTFLGEK